jgi:hypothetical protein
MAKKYQEAKDYKNATFKVDPEELNQEEKLEVLNILIDNLEIHGEDTLKANVRSKELREKFYIVK